MLMLLDPLRFLNEDMPYSLAQASGTILYLGERLIQKSTVIHWNSQVPESCGHWKSIQKLAGLV